MIPEQLTHLNQWVTWNHDTRGGKPTKIPYIAGENRRASSTDATTWKTYREAEADRTKSGVGFVFTDDDPFVGIDLDDCLLPDGRLKEWAAHIVAKLPDTYAEVSPSGNGLKLFVAGELPAGGRNRRKIGDGQVEIYARGRYFTVTGDRWLNSPSRVASADLMPLYAMLFPESKPAAITHDEPVGGGWGGDNESMIEAIRRGKRGDQFATLFDDGPGDDHSGSDISMCNILAFWCGPNPKRIDRVFRMSALMRDKWDSPRPGGTYGSITIQDAIAKQTSFFQPKDSINVNEDSGVFKRAKADRPYMMTDLGNAERLAEHFRDRIRFCERGGGWYVWADTHWQRDDTGRIVYYAINTVREIWRESRYAEDEEVVESLQKHASKSQAQGRIAAMIKLAQALPGIAVDSDDFDRDAWLFNCRNGTIDLRTGELRPHSPSDNITKVSPAGYHPSAQPTLWMCFLDRIFNGNVELIEYVQEVLGMCLSGDISEQIMPVFYGDGRNGKSTLLDTVMDVMGSYAGKAAPDLLMARQGDVHPTEIADLWGLRLAVASETEEGRKLRVSTVKEMTGDAELKARFMGKDFFNFRRTHKLVLMTNHRPRITESKQAIWRRLKLVPFTAEIRDDERDRQLGSKLKREWTGILSWLVQGCMRWHESEGLDDPAEVRDATASYRDDEDPLAEYVASRLDFHADGYVSYGDLRRSYRAWCQAEGVTSPLGDRSLFNRLAERRGVDKVRRSVGGVQSRGLSGVAIGEISAD